ncbi:ABC transporter permease [Amycolatopsis jejuensis]|uniref:ABC transporter permease n=1 Tax=Amycolatopsis jejuensis TaxID=330084 RepID=UPI00052501D3|nr:ABC transporter permease subunit [Amycolatopsis jejuensis]
MKSVRRRLAVLGIEIWLPVLLVVAWWVASRDSESFYFPPLKDIWARFVGNWIFSGIPEFLLPSLANLGIGFALAVVAGIVAGLLLGLVPALYRRCWLLLELFRATPMIVLVPLAIMFFGVGSTEKIILIAVASVWPILLGTTDGLREVDPLVSEISRCYRVPLAIRLTRVMLPAALPQILAGTRVSVSIAVSMMVGSELFASTEGIGYFVLRTRETSAVTDLWTAIILLGLLGYLINLLYGAVEHVLLGWHRGLRAVEANAK